MSRFLSAAYRPPFYMLFWSLSLPSSVVSWRLPQVNGTTQEAPFTSCQLGSANGGHQQETRRCEE